MSHFNRRHFFKEDYFEEINTKNKAYLLGFILGDGHIRAERNGNPNGLEIASIDYSVLTNLLDEVTGDYNYIKDKKIYYSLQLSSKKLAEDLISQGILFKRKSYVQKFIQTPFPIEFLRGLIDSDGWVLMNPVSRGKYSINVGVCGTKEVVKGFKYNFNKYIMDGGYIQKTGNIYRYDFETTNVSKIKKIYNKLYKKNSLFLPRKRNKFLNFLRQVKYEPTISASDYPGNISLFVPLPGCKKYCPWCFNSTILDTYQVDYEYILKHLTNSIEYIDAIIFGGAEPTHHIKNLNQIIEIAKRNNIKLGIQTSNINDYNVKKIREIFDYICCTVNNLTQKQYMNGPNRILINDDILFENKIIYIPEHTIFPQKLRGNIVVQQFQPGECLNPEYNKIHRPTRDEVLEFAINIDANYIITEENGREVI